MTPQEKIASTLFLSLNNINYPQKVALTLQQYIKKDFIDAFPELKVSDISNLLQELKEEDKIERVGSERAGFWKIKGDKK